MFCNVCGKPNRDGAKFCRFCGNKLEEDIVCPRCGSAMDEDDLFCEKCGYKKGEEKVEKPVEKAKEEYPVFESETPIDYGDTKPIIEEYEITHSDKTIEDYCFDKYEEVPDMANPYDFSKDKYDMGIKDEKPAEETFYKEEKKDRENFYVEDKKVLSSLYKEEKKPEKVKEVPSNEPILPEKKEVGFVPKNYNGKRINIMLLIVSFVIIAMMFLPYFSSRKTDEYVRNSFAALSKENFMNYITFFKFFFSNTTIVINEKVDKLYYLVIIAGATIVLISMMKIFISAISKIKEQKFNEKYDKPFVVCFVATLSMYVALGLNSIPIYIVLSLSLAVLLFKYFYEKKYSASELIKTTFLFVILGIFLLSMRNIGINISNASYSKFGIGSYFEGIINSGVLNGYEDYEKDLISFLGWATSFSLAISTFFGIVVLIKIIRAVYADERHYMPIISMSISLGSVFLAFFFLAFAKSNCNKKEVVTNCGFNGWTVVVILSAIALCALFGLMNYSLNKTKKKEKK